MVNVGRFIKPPCGCKPTNVNNFAPAKSDPLPLVSSAPSGYRSRPPKQFSLQVSTPNYFRQKPPKTTPSWTQSSTQANPRFAMTPGKEWGK